MKDKDQTKEALKSGDVRDIEDIYQKKSHRTHVLLRPEPYLGSVVCETTTSWVLSSRDEKMELKV